MQANTGYITGYDGSFVPFNERFFRGGDSFRGFSLAGVGARDLVRAVQHGALGGKMSGHLRTVEARLPGLLPESYGIGLALFSDFGTWAISTISSRAPAPARNIPALARA